MKERNEGERAHNTKSVDYLRKQNLSPVSHLHFKKRFANEQNDLKFLFLKESILFFVFLVKLNRKVSNLTFALRGFHSACGKKNVCFLNEVIEFIVLRLIQK